MRFNPCQCPECDQPATGTVEIIPGLALLVFDEEGQCRVRGRDKNRLG